MAVQTAKTLAALNSAETGSVPLEFRAILANLDSASLANLQSLVAGSPATLKAKGE